MRRRCEKYRAGHLRGPARLLGLTSDRCLVLWRSNDPTIAMADQTIVKVRPL